MSTYIYPSWYQVQFLLISADREKTKTFTLLRHLWIVGYLVLWGRSENENEKFKFFFTFNFLFSVLRKEENVILALSRIFEFFIFKKIKGLCYLWTSAFQKVLRSP